MKFAIKREQSQACLSYVERLRVGEQSSGMREQARCVTSRIKEMQNLHHVEVKECRASCGHRELTEDASRVCQLSKMIMESGFRCSRWTMSDGLQNAGKSGGVVRLKGTQEIVLR